jgi:predicted MFS family arabinose efflux permease
MTTSKSLLSVSPPGFDGVILAGVCATLVGVGLQRFAYAPLLPAMVQQSWLSAADAGTLGAVNFAGYLAGAAMAPWTGRMVGMRAALRLAMALAAVCFALCAWRGSLLWFAPWRALAGITGGWLMVLAGPAVQAAVAPGRRALAGSAMFAGVGIGIVTSAAIVPALLPFGLQAAWLALAAASAALGALAFPFWPDVPAPPRAATPKLTGATGRLVGAYTLSGVAATPYMGWWPDFIARGLGQGTPAGSMYWLLFGLAIAVGAVLCGRLSQRFGAARLFRALMVQQAVALAIPLVSQSTTALVVATLLAGSCMVSLTAMALLLSFELAGAAASGVWRISTVGWAAAQTGAGFALAALYAATGSHLPLFGVGLVAAVAGAFLVRR